MKTDALFTAHKVRRSKAHLFGAPLAPVRIESVTRRIGVRNMQMVMKDGAPRLRMAARDRSVALSLPRVKWMERP